MQENDQCYCIYETASVVENIWGDLCVSDVEYPGFHLLASGRCAHICLGSWKVDLSFSLVSLLWGSLRCMYKFMLSIPNKAEKEKEREKKGKKGKFHCHP